MRQRKIIFIAITRNFIPITQHIYGLMISTESMLLSHTIGKRYLSTFTERFRCKHFVILYNINSEIQFNFSKIRLRTLFRFRPWYPSIALCKVSGFQCNLSKMTDDAHGQKLQVMISHFMTCQELHSSNKNSITRIEMGDQN